MITAPFAPNPTVKFQFWATQTLVSNVGGLIKSGPKLTAELGFKQWQAQQEKKGKFRFIPGNIFAKSAMKKREGKWVAAGENP